MTDGSGVLVGVGGIGLAVEVGGAIAVVVGMDAVGDGEQADKKSVSANSRNENSATFSLLRTLLQGSLRPPASPPGESAFPPDPFAEKLESNELFGSM